MLTKDRRKKLTKDMLEHLTKPETLRQWAGLNLDERAVMLHRACPGVHISGSMISRIYKK